MTTPQEVKLGGSAPTPALASTPASAPSLFADVLTKVMDPDGDLLTDLSLTMKRLFQQNTGDVRILLRDGQTLTVDSHIVRAQSAILDKMLDSCSPFKEGRDREVDLTAHAPVAVRNLFSYLYCRESVEMSPDVLFETLVVADMYDQPKYVARLTKSLDALRQKILTSTNADEVLSLLVVCNAHRPVSDGFRAFLIEFLATKLKGNVTGTGICFDETSKENYRYCCAHDHFKNTLGTYDRGYCYHFTKLKSPTPTHLNVVTKYCCRHAGRLYPFAVERLLALDEGSRTEILKLVFPT